MSNRAVIEVRHSNDDVLVLIEDDYMRTFNSYEPGCFEELFSNVKDLIGAVGGMEEMEGCFYVTPEDEVVLESCTSLEVHGFYPPGHSQEDEVFVYFYNGDEE